jgi:hypothetical protein
MMPLRLSAAWASCSLAIRCAVRLHVVPLDLVRRFLPRAVGSNHEICQFGDLLRLNTVAIYLAPLVSHSLENSGDLCLIPSFAASSCVAIVIQFVGNRLQRFASLTKFFHHWFDVCVGFFRKFGSDFCRSLLSLGQPLTSFVFNAIPMSRSVAS